MRYFRTRMHSRRFVLVSAVIGIIVLGGAAVATASLVGYPQDSVTVMTGCLTSSGTGAGNIVNIAPSPTLPSKACGANQKLVHLSGGTITKITAGTGLTTAGSGGTGGAGFIDNGFATLSLQSSYALPQNCTNGQFPDWGGETWGCGTDQNTTYSAGTGLDLSNANAFSIDSAYQLPQGCSPGQVAKSDGSNNWSCQADNNTTYSGADFATSNQNCPTGQVANGVDASGDLTCEGPAAHSGVYVSAASDVGSGATGSAVVFCPSGLHALSGGLTEGNNSSGINSEPLGMIQDRPAWSGTSGDPAVGWAVVAKNLGANDTSLFAFAICEK